MQNIIDYRLKDKHTGRPRATHSLLGLAMRQFDFLGPNHIVQEFAKQIEGEGKTEHSHKEDNTLGQLQYFQNGIDPDVGVVLDNVNPD